MSNLNYNGQLISQRVSDNYVNATQMCDANGKLVADWKRLASTKEYLEALSSNMGIPINQLVYSSQGSPENGGGTWIHPRLAIELGRWISVSFAIWCDTHIKVLMETGETKLESEVPTRQLPPVRDAKDYFEMLSGLDQISDLNLRSLLRDRIEDELSTAAGKKLAPAKSPEFTIGKVRATELGYSLQEIGNGSALGRFLAKNVAIAYEQRVGKYGVKHYEVGDALDTAIKTYFGLKRALK